MKRQNQPKKQLQSYARFSGIAFQMLAIIIIGTFAGIKLDKLYPNKHSLFTIILSLLAIGMAMYYVIRKVTKPSNKNK